MARRTLGQRARSKPLSLPAPTGGWNTRDAISAMAPTDAVFLTNYFPATTDVVLRFGHTRNSTGIAGQVETLIAYSGSTTNKLFGIASGSIYDCTAAGAVGAPSVTGLTNSRFQYVNIATPGGNFISMVNGADGVRTFDGTTWATQSITGVTATKLINVNVFKNRQWFCETGTLKAWYLPVQSIAGAAAALDLSAFAPHGGFLMAMGTWTIDAGYGVDDLAVFITSNGDVIVYRGTDPSSATTWALVGVFYMGSPIGRRCFVKYKGDLLIITQDGLVPLSTYLQSSRLDPRLTLTDKIQYTMGQAVSLYGANFGWQVIPYAKENMLILNVPIQQGMNQQQYVMNTINGSWCNFTDWNANCWEIFQDNLYFGGNTFVGKGWSTNADNGAAIVGNGLQAFNDFGDPGRVKRFTMMQPTILTNGSPSIQASVNVDFDTSDPTSALSVIPISAGVWDSAVWDVDLWGADLSVSRSWQGANGVGYFGAPHLKSSTTGLQLQWVNTVIVAEPGAVL